jgi:hypothetical protein
VSAVVYPVPVRPITPAAAADICLRLDTAGIPVAETIVGRVAHLTPGRDVTPLEEFTAIAAFVASTDMRLAWDRWQP